MSGAALPTDQLDGVPIREVLQGLARIHSLVVVSDDEGRILWLSDDLGVRCGGTHYIGEDLRRLFAGLAERRCQARIVEQISHIQNHLRSQDSLYEFRLDLGTNAGIGGSVDVSAFRTSAPESGRPLVVLVVHPVERDEREDRRLRVERDALKSMVASAPDAVLAVDRFGFISYANPAVEAVLGISPERLLKQPIALFLPRAPAFVQLMSKLCAIGELRDRELELKRPDGTRVWLSVAAHRNRTEDGRPGGGVIFLRDVTQQVAERQRLQRKNAELENYVHAVSHDLRLPLVSLLGFTRLLRQDYDAVLDETGRHFADRIEQAGRTMESLIDQLLELSRIGAGGEHATLIDPRGVLQQLKAELKLQLDEAGATLEIPDSPPPVYCDRTRLYQIFSNLVGNALKHMGPCQDRRITVDVRTAGSAQVVTVTDRGRGIPPEDHERIFEAFQSRPPVPRAARSTGMGLTIVKKIAETYGGAAWVESEPDRGARFFVTLPRP